MAIAGEDIIYKFTLTDDAAGLINYADVQSIEVEFKNSIHKSLRKSKADNTIVEGATTNEYVIELQDAETALLSDGEIDVIITVINTSASFGDGEATSIIKTKITLD